MSKTLKGVVKWFNDAKGFGFIENPEGDVFVHYSSIEWDGFKTLKDGEEVLYEVEKGTKGLHAKKVKRVAKAASSSQDASKGLAASIEKEVTNEIELEEIPGASIEDASESLEDTV